MRSFARTAVAIAAAVLTVGAGASAATATSPSTGVSLGTYKGVTSQGQKIELKLVKSKCDASTAPFKLHNATCFVGIPYNSKLGAFYPKVLEPCADGSTYSDPLYVASYKIALSAGGRFSFTQHGLGSGGDESGNVSTLTFHVSGAKITGSLHQTESYDDGSGVTTCNSKIVTFTAKKSH